MFQTQSKNNMTTIHLLVTLFINLLFLSNASRIMYGGRQLIPYSMCPQTSADRESVLQFHPLTGREMIVTTYCSSLTSATSAFIVSLPNQPSFIRTGLPVRRPAGNSAAVFAAWDRLGNIITAEPGSQPSSSVLLKKFSPENILEWELELELFPVVWEYSFDEQNNLIFGNLVQINGTNGIQNLTKITYDGQKAWSFSLNDLNNNIGFGIRYFYRFFVTDDGFTVLPLTKSCCPANNVILYIDPTGTINIGPTMLFPFSENGLSTFSYNNTCFFALETVKGYSVLSMWCQSQPLLWFRVEPSLSTPDCVFFQILQVHDDRIIYYCENNLVQTLQIANRDLMSPVDARSLNNFVHVVNTVFRYSPKENLLALKNKCVGAVTADGLQFIAGVTYWILLDMDDWVVPSTTSRPLTTPTATKSPGNLIPREAPSAGQSLVAPIAISVFFGVLCLVAVAYLIYLSKRRKKPSNHVKAKLNSNSQLSTMASIICTTSAASEAGTATAVFSIPSFLEINSQQSIRTKKKIATGNAGVVFLVQVVNENMANTFKTEEAVAKIVEQRLPGVEGQLQFDRFIQEVCSMYYFHQRFPRNFAELFGYDSSTLTIVMRYYPMGSLVDFRYRRLNSRLSRLQIKTIVQDVATALGLMHSEGFAHCDLKSDNVLLVVRAGQVRAILADLGISKIVDDSAVQLKGVQFRPVQGMSVRYAAPEIIQYFSQYLLSKQFGNLEFTMKVNHRSADIYSLGCVLFEALTGRRPWAQSDKK